MSADQLRGSPSGASPSPDRDAATRSRRHQSFPRPAPLPRNGRAPYFIHAPKHVAKSNLAQKTLAPQLANRPLFAWRPPNGARVWEEVQILGGFRPVPRRVPFAKPSLWLSPVPGVSVDAAGCLHGLRRIPRPAAPPGRCSTSITFHWARSSIENPRVRTSPASCINLVEGRARQDHRGCPARSPFAGPDDWRRR